MIRLLNNTLIRNGTLADYRRLCRFHYRSDEPATVDRIYRATLSIPTVADRFTHCDGSVSVVGVLVVSFPTLDCAARERVLGHYWKGLSRGMRARVINREVRTISRVIVDPRARGLGIATSLVRHAIDHSTTPFVESIAAMGRIHPFFERAGMMRFDPSASSRDDRLIAALQSAGLTIDALLSPARCRDFVESLAPSRRDWLLRELVRWRRGSARRGDHTGPPNSLLKLLGEARQSLSAPPSYFFREIEFRNA